MTNQTPEEIKANLLAWLDSVREMVQSDSVQVVAAVARGGSDLDIVQGQRILTGYQHKSLELNYTVLDKDLYAKYLARLNGSHLSSNPL